MIEKTVRSKTIYDGKLLRFDVFDVELGNGARAVREVVRHPGAVAVLAQLPDERFVLVRQYRKPIEKDIVEVVAGTLEPGEDPADCAERELNEETGYKSEGLRNLGDVYLSPGYSDEKIHLFYARLLPGARNPRPEDDEKLDIVYYTGEEIEEMISAGEIMDAKTLAVWMLYKRKMTDVRGRKSADFSA